MMLFNAFKLFTDNVWYCLHAVCGENFYRLTETQCSGCPENSVRPLNESDSMCACENGYSRRQEDQIDQPCVRKLKWSHAVAAWSEYASLTHPPPSLSLSLSLSLSPTPILSAHIGFVNASLTFQERNVPNSVSIPLYLSATSSREITVTFTVTPSMYMSLIGSQVVFPPGARMQV